MKDFILNRKQQFFFKNNPDLAKAIQEIIKKSEKPIPDPVVIEKFIEVSKKTEVEEKPLLKPNDLKIIKREDYLETLAKTEKGYMANIISYYNYTSKNNDIELTEKLGRIIKDFQIKTKKELENE